MAKGSERTGPKGRGRGRGVGRGRGLVRSARPLAALRERLRPRAVCVGRLAARRLQIRRDPTAAGPRGRRGLSAGGGGGGGGGGSLKN